MGRVRQAATHNGTFNESEYLSAGKLRAKFGFTTEFSPIPNGEDFRVQLSAEEMADMTAQVDNRVAVAVKEAHRALWARLVTPVAAMVERLSDPDHKFKDSLVGNFKEIVGLIPRAELKRRCSAGILPAAGRKRTGPLESRHAARSQGPANKSPTRPPRSSPGCRATQFNPYPQTDQPPATSNRTPIRPDKLTQFLRAAIRNGRRVLVKGKPGIGKTEIARQATDSVLAADCGGRGFAVSFARAEQQSIWSELQGKHLEEARSKQSCVFLCASAQQI